MRTIAVILIASLYDLSQAGTIYRAPHTEYGVPEEYKEIIIPAAPLPIAEEYGVPKSQPAQEYGVPVEEYVAPIVPVVTHYSYDIPSSPAIVQPKVPGSEYGVPSAAPAEEYGIPEAPIQPHEEYGVPKLAEIVEIEPVVTHYSYEIPSAPVVPLVHSAPAQEYGVPAQEYGVPAVGYAAPHLAEEKTVFEIPSAPIVPLVHSEPAQQYGAPLVAAEKPVISSYSYEIPSAPVVPLVKAEYGVPAKEYGVPAEEYVAPHSAAEKIVLESLSAPIVPLVHSAPAQEYGTPYAAEEKNVVSSYSYELPTAPVVLHSEPAEEYGVPAEKYEVPTVVTEPIAKYGVPHATYGVPAL